MLKIFHISDTHGHHEKQTIPEDTELLICSGDVTNHIDPVRNFYEMDKFVKWWNAIDVPNKVFVPGNHDAAIEHGMGRALIDDMDGLFLEHQEGEICGYKVFGSPYCPIFGRWPYMKTNDFLERAWNQIPDETEILITHCPPEGVRDEVQRQVYMSVNHFIDKCGCPHLANKMWEIKPILHCFGHIHEGRGTPNHGVHQEYGTIFSNASMMKDFAYGREFNMGNRILIPKKD